MTLLVSFLSLTIIGWSANYLLVGRPVAEELRGDPRNSGYTLKAHYRYYLDPNTLVLDLTEAKEASPIDLFRAIFQSTRILSMKGRRFERVILSRSRVPIFNMKGETFFAIGSEFEAGENPVYLIRTLPEKLNRPNGEPAFGTWEGGWLGVTSKQLDDANEAAREWSQGRRYQ